MRQASSIEIGGAQFLRAVALGYDVGARILITLRPGLNNSHKATHAIAGHFGAAAAAGSAASLTPQQMRWMLDYTAQQCSGIASWYRDRDHIEKGFVYGGMPARSGVTSALLVHAGWTGVDDVLSGRDNFLLANAPDAKPELLIEQLGERYEVARTNLKRWTVGSPIQAPLDAMEALLKRRPIDPKQVQQVLLRSAPGSVVDNSDPPDINIQFAMALMLIGRDGDLQVDSRQSADAGAGDSQPPGEGRSRSTRQRGERRRRCDTQATARSETCRRHDAHTRHRSGPRHEREPDEARAAGCEVP